MITNDGSKAVGIFPTTPINFPATMTVSNLTISAPSDGSLNTLLLNYFGTNVPLNVLSDCVVGTNGRILSLYSGLQVGASLEIVTNASFMQQGGVTIVTNGEFRVGDGSAAVTNAELWLSTVSVYDFGDFTQSGGTLSNQYLFVEGGFNFNTGSDANYSLRDGDLFSGGVSVYYDAGFLQVGGRHIVNGQLEIYGYYNNYEGYILSANYTLRGGFLSCGSFFEDVLGSFDQNGGTNQVSGYLDISTSRYNLNSGMVSDFGTTIGPNDQVDATNGLLLSIFHQSGGVHMTGELDCEGTYQLDGGVLIASTIYLDGGELVIGPSPAVTVSNALSCQMSGGAIQLSNSTQQLAPLTLYSNYLAFSPHSLVNFGSRNCKLTFADSSRLTWDSGATLTISNWNGSATGGGGDQIIFGNSSSGLTPTQLQHLQFASPAGFSTGVWFAKILPSGEVVPTAVPPLTEALNGSNLVVNWPTTNFNLQASTNLSGPFEDVTNSGPYTNNTGQFPQRFFRLHE
jgi:hypothetical protein